MVRYPEECLSLAEAVYAYTVGAAYSGGEEEIKPVRWRRASWRTWRCCPRTSSAPSWAALLATHAVATMVGGEFVYTDDSLL